MLRSGISHAFQRFRGLSAFSNPPPAVLHRMICRRPDFSDAPPSCCGRHSGDAWRKTRFSFAAAAAASMGQAAHGSFLPMSAREARAVDLSLKMNVLAVCAVFVFVGAILLG